MSLFCSMQIYVSMHFQPNLLKNKLFVFGTIHKVRTFWGGGRGSRQKHIPIVFVTSFYCLKSYSGGGWGVGGWGVVTRCLKITEFECTYFMDGPFLCSVDLVCSAFKFDGILNDFYIYNICVTITYISSSLWFCSH